MKITKIISTIILSLGLLSSPVFATSMLQPVTDSVNSGIINTKLLADRSLSNTTIDATVVNGIAVFSGTVNSKAQVNELIRIGHSISGIRGVDVSRVRVSK